MPDDIPVLVGSGQFVLREPSTDDLQRAPLDFIAEAACRAVADAGAQHDIAPLIDTIAVIRTVADSVEPQYAKLGNPFGTSSNIPRSLARRLGSEPTTAIYGPVGGHSPQRLLNELAARIAAGESKVALLAGGEATAFTKQILKAGDRPDWSEQVLGSLDDRGLGEAQLSAKEIAHGMTSPLQVYPLLEHALRARMGQSRAEHRQAIGQLFEGFAAVAAQNPYAQFPQARSAEFLSTVSESNYALSDAYTRWVVAQETVNQSAAVLLMSTRQATDLGIPPERWVYLHGYADADDCLVSQRPDIGDSAAMHAAGAAALAAASKQISDMALLDIYSCFPVAVFAACQALGIDWRQPPAPLTVTGGLPFFGGPGNAYSLHAIAEMTTRLRTMPGRFGLVWANGGFLSKQSVGIYSSTPPVSPAYPMPRPMELEQTLVEPASVGQGVLAIESHMLVYERNVPRFACVVARDDAGRRLLAKVANGDTGTLELLAAEEPIGRHIQVEVRDGKHYFRLIEASGKPLPYSEVGAAFRDSYDDCLIERRGEVLLVMLNRESLRNAISPRGSRELAEIFRAYEADPMLRVAVLTGAGETAFCSGNDLKFMAGASAAEMALPPEGFGGLTSFFERRKPVIAAVNGLAYGGGFEMVLACDLVVASRTARFALPEPKVGLAALAGGMHRLPRQLPLKQAMGLLLTGDSLDADQAQAAGLVNEVVEPARLIETALAWADKVIACSPASIAITLEGVRQGLKQSNLQSAVALDDELARRLARSADFREGIKAFADKRPPIWKGR